jgi:hypothetical protein
LAVALVCSAVTVFAVAWLKNPYGRPANGVCVEREYYLYSPSSQAKILESVDFAESFFLTGEKATFCFESEAAAAEYACALLQEKGMKIVWEESWGNVQSVYAYAANRERGIRLPCGRVNLHVVLQGAYVQVGTPIIFGGY